MKRNILLAFCLVAIVCASTGCEHKGTIAPKDQMLNKNRIRLENQDEHSGIMVQIAELGRITITDSLGICREWG